MRKTIATVILTGALVVATVPAYAVESDDTDSACPVATRYWHDRTLAAEAQATSLQATIAAQQEKIAEQRALIRRLRQRLASR